MRLDAKELEQLRLRILDYVVWNNSFVSVCVRRSAFLAVKRLLLELFDISGA
jgi:hypothetical protein